MIKGNQNNSSSGWAESEFGIVNFGDKRLSKRLLKIADSFANSPECSINRACDDWHQSKAAYRFFQNDAVSERKILDSHITKTIERAKNYPTILAIQDTSYISYKNHKKTEGLGIIAARVRSKTTNFQTHGLVMHTTFAVTTEGLPIGLLDQKISSRPLLDETVKELKKRSHNIALPIEEKESMRWIESLEHSNNYPDLKNAKVVTVCDREADIYDLFEVASTNQCPFVVRARQDRTVNKTSIYSKKSGEKLWDLVSGSPCRGEIQVTIPARDNKPKRTATLEVRFDHFVMNPPKNNVKRKTRTLPDLKLNAVYVIEQSPPLGEEPMNWMLLTNIDINNFEEAVEKIQWYCLRWRIEIFHKILKSGFKVEECRLGAADRLVRFLTIMSVIAWRIFFITLVARESPDLPCSFLLANEEWNVLYTKIHHTKHYPETPPTIKEAVKWIAQLGGFLARKNDGEPG
ncbi:TPA: IS4-like element ISLpn5 family transposase, partial [Legionella pneumophila]|nr:IS4-like element ISLpn5 family transposase [Legionella pneumophila]